MKNNSTVKKDLINLLRTPVPFEMDLPWKDYAFSRRFYDIIHDWGTPTELEVNFIDSFVKSGKNRLLDLTSGGGRHALGLAELGHQVTAVEIGGYPIKYARELGQKKGCKVRFVQSDVREIKFKNEFDLVYLICGQLGHFSPEDVAIIFKNSSLALINSGMFIIHLPVFQPTDKENVTLWYQEKRPFYFSNPSIVHREQYYFHDQRIKLIRDFAVDTVSRKNRLFGVSEKNYNLEEIEDFGRQSHFELIHKYGSYSKDPLTKSSTDNIYVFAKT